MGMMISGFLVYGTDVVSDLRTITDQPPSAQYRLPCAAMLFGHGDSNMELRHLRYFVAVAENLNFTRAAALLRIAQPALSRQVQDLEDEIGVDLLTRSTRGVTLTAEGKLFLEETRELLRRVDEAVAKTRALARGEYGELHIGYSPSPTVELLPLALEAFQKTVPRVTVNLHDLAGNELSEGVRSGRLELAVMQRPQEANAAGLIFEPLLTNSICIAIPPTHPFAKMKSVPLVALAKEKLVVFHRREYADYHALLARVLHGMNPRPAIAGECDGASSLITEIAAGRGIAILPLVFEKIVGARLKLRPLAPAPAPQEIGIVRTIKGDVTPAGEKFCTHLRAVAQKLVESHA
jgi:DNA-binding transcriptional LysR family regulator